MEFEKIVLQFQDKAIPIEIPDEMVKEFRDELRIVVKHPWVVGIPVPERLLKPDLIRRLRGNFEVVLTPQLQR